MINNDPDHLSLKCENFYVSFFYYIYSALFLCSPYATITFPLHLCHSSNGNSLPACPSNLPPCLPTLLPAMAAKKNNMCVSMTKTLWLRMVGMGSFLCVWEWWVYSGDVVFYSLVVTDRNCLRLVFVVCFGQGDGETTLKNK